MVIDNHLHVEVCFDWNPCCVVSRKCLRTKQPSSERGGGKQVISITATCMEDITMFSYKVNLKLANHITVSCKSGSHNLVTRSLGALYKLRKLRRERGLVCHASTALLKLDEPRIHYDLR